MPSIEPCGTPRKPALLFFSSSSTAFTEQILTQSQPQPHKSPNHFSNKPYLWQHLTVCLAGALFSLSLFLFSLSVYVWMRKQSFLSEHTPLLDSVAESVEAQLWVNFALTLKPAMWVLVLGGCPPPPPSTEHWWLSNEEVNGTGKQEVPLLWLTACLDTKRWIEGERWRITTYWPDLKKAAGHAAVTPLFQHALYFFKFVLFFSKGAFYSSIHLLVCFIDSTLTSLFCFA